MIFHFHMYIYTLPQINSKWTNEPKNLGLLPQHFLAKTLMSQGVLQYIYIYPQTGTFADPETHPLRGFGPLCRYRVLAFGRFFLDKVLRNGLLRYILYTCPNLWCNSCSKCYGMDCFGTYFTHVQTCDVTRVQSATEWTASVHTLHMSKPVM